MGKLDGKTAIVTGSAAGIGKAIALAYLNEGANVAIADFDEGTMNATVKELSDAGHNVIGVKVNVANNDDVVNMVDKTVEAFGKVDILVNNAGVGDNMEAAGNITDATWERVMAINMNGVMYAMRKVIPHFLEQGGGAIVNMASITGVTGGRGGIAYTAVKHAVVGMTKNVASHYGPEKIRCNAIAPSSVDTGFAENMTNVDEYGMKMATRAVDLMPRAGTTEEISNIALFLASDEAAYINGVTLPVYGGWSAY